MSKNLGEIARPIPPTEKPKIILPPSLARLRGYESYKGNYAHSVATYGLFEVEFLRSTPLGFGRSGDPGDRAKLPGNLALEIVLDGGAKFVGDFERQQKVLAEAEEIMKPKRLKDDPAFQPAIQQQSSFAAATAARTSLRG